MENTPKIAINNIYILLCLCSVLLGWAGAWFISKTTYRQRLLDYPNERSSHEEATPKGGGIGILAAFIVVSILLDMPAAFIFSAILISLVSFCADSREISVKIRLFAHFIAAFLLVLPFSLLWMPAFAYMLFIVLFYVLFIVTTANFYNFMDGINGLAGVFGITAFGLIVLYYFQFLHINTMPFSAYAVLAGCLAFSCLGFLPSNMPRARVFMGDVGSILLGFVFAGIVVVLSNTFLDFICLASFLFLFYADEFTTMLIRLRKREKLTEPHRRHLYQILVNEFQFPHWKVTMLYASAQLIIGFSIMFIRQGGAPSVFSALIIYFILFLSVSFYFRRKRVPA